MLVEAVAFKADIIHTADAPPAVAVKDKGSGKVEVAFLLPVL